MTDPAGVLDVVPTVIAPVQATCRGARDVSGTTPDPVQLARGGHVRDVR